MSLEFTPTSIPHAHRVKYGVRFAKFIWAPVYSCTHWLRPHNSPPPHPPAFGLIYEGAIGHSR